jgi:S-adenosylmethionine synthetase
MKRDFMFTSESVTEGHPDKVCDQISDAIVDRFLARDPYSKIVTECAVANGVVFIAARFASQATIDVPDVARSIIQQVGYESGEFNARDCAILTSLRELSPAEYHPVDERELTDDELDRIGAENQVTVFGFACNQTNALMPLPIWLAHRLARRLTAARLQRELRYLLPDGKTQVGVEYRNRKPHRIHSITLIASQAEAGFPDSQRLRDDLIERVIQPVFAQESIRPDDRTQIWVNPNGTFVGGGPSMHSGLTGRKNAIDLYGEYSRQSGAALSGKGPMRIDRMGAYAARHAAKYVVAGGLAEECELQLSYSIGHARPVSVQVETYGTGIVDDEEIARRVQANFDFRVAGIVARYNLRYQPAILKGSFYKKLAAYGHVGRMDIGLPWERVEDSSLLR